MGPMLRYTLGQIRTKDVSATLSLVRAILQEVCLIPLSVLSADLMLQLYQTAQGNQMVLNEARDVVRWMSLTFGPTNEKDRFRSGFVDIHKYVAIVAI